MLLEAWYIFWRNNKKQFNHTPDEPVYVFSSIFAPSELTKAVSHRWRWYNPESEAWEVQDNIGFEITGGRDGGYRGYTYKNNVQDGQWKVDVITEEGHILGIIDFELRSDPSFKPKMLVEEAY